MECARQQGRLLTTVLFFTTYFLITSVSSAEENIHADWTITLGVGAFHGPEYEGSDETETIASPDFEVVWRDRVILNPDGLGINYYNRGSLILNAYLSQGEGRKTSLSTSLNGVGDIDASTTLTLGIEFELGLFLSFANLTKHSGGTEGTQAMVGLETALPLRLLMDNMDLAAMELMGETEDFTFIGPLITAGLSADWADDDYTSGFFSIDAGQSALSGLPQYTAGDGFKSVNLELGVLYPVNQSWTVHGLAGYSKLIGDAEDSPIVRDDDHIFVGGFINYHF